MQKIKINIKATNIKLTSKIRDHIDQKIPHILKFMKHKQDEEAIFNIEVGKTTNSTQHGNIERCEINLDHSGSFYRVEAIKENLFEAIDKASEELIRKVRKNKEKRFDMIKKGASKIKKITRK